jgi:DNA topoisomerase-3
MTTVPEGYEVPIHRSLTEGKAPLEQFLQAVEVQLGELVARARSAGPLRLPGGETRPCPAQGCGGSLRKREGRTGAFWACSRYPECRVTEDAGAPKTRRRRSTMAG